MIGDNVNLDEIKINRWASPSPLDRTPRRAGQQGDGALLTPEERRKMNDYETKTKLADRVARKAQYQKTRCQKLMAS